MAQKKNSDRISIANIISMIGIAALAVLTYLGVLYTGASLSVAIIVAIVVSALNFLLLWFICKAKSAENYLGKWIIVEIATVIVYIGCAVGSTMLCGIPQFFAVNADRDNFKNIAYSDIAKVSAMFENFENNTTAALNTYKSGLENATQNGARHTEELKQHLRPDPNSAPSITNNPNSIEEAVIVMERRVMGNEYLTLSAKKDQVVEDITTNIENWNMFNIPMLNDKLYNIAEEAERILNNISQEQKIPYIETTTTTIGSGKRARIVNAYGISYPEASEYAIEGGIDSLQLHTYFSSSFNFNIWGIIVAIVIHLVIIFNYIVMYRTRTLTIGPEGGNPRGIDL